MIDCPKLYDILYYLAKVRDNRSRLSKPGAQFHQYFSLMMGICRLQTGIHLLANVLRSRASVAVN